MAAVATATAVVAVVAATSFVATPKEQKHYWPGLVHSKPGLFFALRLCSDCYLAIVFCHGATEEGVQSIATKRQKKAKSTSACPYSDVSFLRALRVLRGSQTRINEFLRVLRGSVVKPSLRAKRHFDPATT